MVQIAVYVVLDQRHAALVQQFHQAFLVVVGHGETERVLRIRHGDHGRDLGAIERELERLERDAYARMGGNLQRFDAHAFEDLQQAEIRRRLQRDGVAGPGDGAHAEVKCFHAAVGHDDVGCGEIAAEVQRFARNLAAQFLIARRQHVMRERQRFAAGNRRNQALQLCGRHMVRTGTGGAEGHHAGPARIQNFLHQRADADQLRRSRRVGDGRLAGRWRAMADIVAGVRPRLDQPAVLEHFVGAQDRGDRDAALRGQAPHRRHALARPQGAHGDHSRDRVGDGFVKDEFLGHCAHSMVGPRGRTGTAAATFDHNSFRFGKL